MEPRRFRIAGLFEWAAAAAAVVGVVWLLSVPLQRAIGPRVDAAPVDAATGLPPGVPAGATSVPVIILLDGREVRVGDLHARLETLLPESSTEGPAHVSASEFGERHTRAYLVDGTRFYVVCERLESGGAFRVAGVFLP